MSALVALALAAGSIDPAALRVVATVDARYLSYNVEMVEVTGGRFWKPYREGPAKDATDRYSYRPPLDLANARLVKLATALGPAYVRVSGTWASATYIAARDGNTVPTGFTTVLTPTQWRRLSAFAKATRGEVVLSAPTSPGTRDGKGVWQPQQLEALLRQSQAVGIRVAGVAFMNEPNLIGLTGAPAGYSVADYARDYANFARTVRRVVPSARLLGPGAVGGASLGPIAALGGVRTLPAPDLIAASKPNVDVYTYHHYGAVSQRCATSGPLSTTIADARDPEWLARTEETLSYHAGLRDMHAKDVPIWVTETAQAACGGAPWAATFVDTPRFVDQLGRLARGGVSAVFHNTLAASDYALLDERDFAPRPNYWAALLWSRLIGTKVLNLPNAVPTLRIYAHCLKDASGGVALIAINLGTTAAAIDFKGRGRVYAMAGANDDRAVTLNGTLLTLGANDTLPPGIGMGVPVNGSANVAPGGVVFVALRQASAKACR